MQVSRPAILGVLAGAMVISATVSSQAFGGDTAGGSQSTLGSGTIDTAQVRHAASGTRVTTIAGGHAGDVLQSLGVWQAPIDPGLYDVTLRAVVIPQPTDPSATSGSAICGVVNLNTLGSDNTRIYLAQSSTQILGDGPPLALSGAATVRIKPGAAPGLVCFSTDGDLQLYQAIAASFTTVDHRRTVRATPVDTAKRNQIERLLAN